MDEDSAEQGIEEVSLDGFDASVATIHAFALQGRCFQITKSGVSSTGSHRWQPAAGSSITVAAQCGAFVAVGLSGGRLTLLKVTADSLEQVKCVLSCLLEYAI